VIDFGGHETSHVGRKGPRSQVNYDGVRDGMVFQEDIEKQVAFLAGIQCLAVGIGNLAWSCGSRNVDQVPTEFKRELLVIRSFLVKIQENVFNGLGIAAQRFVWVVCFVDTQFRGFYELAQLVFLGPVVVCGYSSNELGKNVETVPKDSQRGFVQQMWVNTA